MLLSLFFSYQFANGQYQKTSPPSDHENYCKTHDLTKILYEKNPDFETEVQTELDKIYHSGIMDKYKNDGCSEIITVPVVIHYIYDIDNMDSGYDTDAYITNTIMTGLNNYYQKQDDVDDNLAPAFQGTAANGTCVEWCLSQFDHPDDVYLYGNDINRDGVKDANGDGKIDEGQFAINRYATSASNIASIANHGPSDQQQSVIHGIASAWPIDEYLNIYVVPDLINSDGGYITSGYTYLPNNFSDEHNCIYVDFNFANSGTTIAHECGHWLGLQHVWQSDGCGREDNWMGNSSFPISDTFEQNTSSLTTGGGTCNATSDSQIPQSCGSVDNIYNIMDYGGCANFFTAQQAVHMNLCLNELNTAGRKNFSNQLNQTKCQAPSAPVANFTPTSGTVNTCLGETISFTDLSSNAPTSWSWTFSGSALSNIITSSVESPSIIPDQTGNISASLTVSNSQGSNSIGPFNVYANIVPAGSPECPPSNNECFGAINISSAFAPSCPATTSVLGTYDNTKAYSSPSDKTLTGYSNGLTSGSGLCCLCENDNNTDTEELHNTLWFSFTPSTSGYYAIDAIAQSSTNGCGGVMGTNEDTQMLIYESMDGTCNTLNFFDCNEDGPKASGTNYPAGGLFNFNAGRTYYLIIDEYNFGTLQSGTFCLEIYFQDCGASIPGCTDPIACNYNSGANSDDGSCNPRDCANNCSGVNTGPAVAGTACNDGNPNTENDVYDVNCNCTGSQISGCTDENACNFNPNATVDNGTCNPKDCDGNCNGINTGPAGAGFTCNDGDPTTTNDVYDINCNCAGNTIQGCTDENACNFNPNATVDNGTCNPKDCDGNCNGINTGPAGAGFACNDGDPTTTNDVYDINCNCAGNVIQGCTDANACNFNPNATVDNGTCNPKDCDGNCNGSLTGPASVGFACNDGDQTTTNDVYDINCNCAGNTVQGCTDENACNFNPNATVDNGTCNPKDCDGNCNGINTGPAGAGFTCNDGDPTTTNDVYDINCNCAGNAIQGCTDANACNFNPNATVDNGTCNPKDCDGNCNGSLTGPAGAGFACNDGDPTTTNDVYDVNCNCAGDAIQGCTDANACNFNPNATVDNGTCNPKDCDGNCNGSLTGPAGAGFACNDGDPTTTNDVYDVNCNCAGDAIQGCTDANACNFNPNATVDNGTCNPKDCDGNCNGSLTGPAGAGFACNDGDPTTTNDVYDVNCNCAGNTVQGCTDSNACNFNPNATVDNGTCNPKDCDGNCNGSLTGPAGAGFACNDGDPTTTNDVYDVNCNCAGNIIQGCTDANACNFNPNATVDNGTCNPKDCDGNCNGVLTGPIVAGSACNDGDPTTTNDVYDVNCNCAGNTVQGCTDANACNFNPNATVDNGTCNPKDCDGNCNGVLTGPIVAGSVCNDGDPTTTNDVYDINCNCAGNTVQGCTDANACNFNPNATVDNGTCNPKDCDGNCNGSLTGPASVGFACNDGDPTTTNDVYDVNCNCAGDAIQGCTDANACNFNPNATVDNGTCNSRDCDGNCNGINTGPTGAGFACNDGDPTTTNDVYDINCNCAGNTVQGCTDANACNFNPNATVDNGTCNPKDCDGNCNGVLTGPIVAGSACNDGNPTTTNDVYDINCNCAGNAIQGCTDANACNFNPNATVDNGTCNPKDCDGNCNGSLTGPASVGFICNDGDPTTTNDVYDVNCNCAGNVIQGCTDANACNFNLNATVDNGTCNPKDCAGNCNGINTGPAGAGFTCNDSDSTTTNDVYDVNCNCAGNIIQGCTDANACNFNPNATVDNGTCNPKDCDGNCNGSLTGPAGVGFACDDENPTTTNDVYDINCNCAGNAIQGCTDANACNFNPNAMVDNGTCNPKDCDGNCNGVLTGPIVAGSACNDGDPTTTNDVYDINCNCTGDAIQGCTDANACNFNPNATVDNGTCNPRDCAGNCNGSFTGPSFVGSSCDDENPATSNDVYDINCNCKGDTIEGCTDENACNFSPDATIDNGSCNPADCIGNCNGDLTGSATIGSSCDDENPITVNDTYNENCDCSGTIIQGCTDANACNYNPNATVDNGACNPRDCAGNCNGNTTGPATTGSPCDDGNPATDIDVYDLNCNCGGAAIVGCTDSNACNFNPDATVENGSCNPRDCEGACFGSATGFALPETPCDDGDPNSTEDTYDENCNCIGKPTATQNLTIPLPYAGWHMISSYYKPENDSIEVIFKPIIDNIVQIKDLAGNVYVPAFNDFNNGLDIWDVNAGYLIKTNAAIDLELKGTQKVDLDTDFIPLYEGWNLIAYWLQGEASPIDVFKGIADDVIQVKSLDGSYVPAFNDFNNIGNMSKTRAYQVKMSAPNSLYYNNSDITSRLPLDDLNSINVFTPNHFIVEKQLNPNSSTLLIMNDEDNPMNIGDEFGIFTSEGKLVSAFIYKNDMMGGLVYGKDETEEEQLGFDLGEKYTFKIWDSQLDEERTAKMQFIEGSETYLNDDLVVVQFDEKINLGVEDFTDKFNISVSPNPTSNDVTFKLSLDKNSAVTIQVYQLDGQLIDLVAADFFNIGVTNINYSTSHLSSGMYLYKVTIGTQIFTDKITIVK